MTDREDTKARKLIEVEYLRLFYVFSPFRTFAILDWDLAEIERS